MSFYLFHLRFSKAILLGIIFLVVCFPFSILICHQLPTNFHCFWYKPAIHLLGLPCTWRIIFLLLSGGYSLISHYNSCWSVSLYPILSCWVSQISILIFYITCEMLLSISSDIFSAPLSLIPPGTPVFLNCSPRLSEVSSLFLFFSCALFYLLFFKPHCLYQPIFKFTVLSSVQIVPSGEPFILVIILFNSKISNYLLLCNFYPYCNVLSDAPL